MEQNTFIKQTIFSLDEIWVIDIKNILLDKFIFFSFIPEDEQTTSVLAEKILEYFEKVQIKTGKQFDELLTIYISNVEKMVDHKVAPTPKPKKGQDTVIHVPRARKYYEKALSYKSQVQKVRSLTDFTRLMMCLYSAIIENKYRVIEDFNYSSECLDIVKIINSMETEPASGLLQRGKFRFDITDIYSTDAATFVLSVILLAIIKNEEVKEV